jgi:hypothetical protein
MKRTYKSAAVVAVIIMAVIVLAIMFGPYSCFLDVLNDHISKGCNFQPFYAGVPGLPSTRELIPELGDLEDAFPSVRAEAMQIFEEHLEALGGGGKGVPRMDETYNEIFRDSRVGGGPLGEAKRYVADKAARAIYGADVGIFDKIGSNDWRTFNLVLYNQDVPGNAERCPELVRLLKRVPGMQSALISIISPGAYIPPHNDPSKGVIRYHLAFKVPRDRANCFIAVDGQRYHWSEGAGVVFDDVYDHWVRNDTDEYRVILFMDILRPLEGVPKALQTLANTANLYHPGVKRLIKASRV